MKDSEVGVQAEMAVEKLTTKSSRQEKCFRIDANCEQQIDNQIFGQRILIIASRKMPVVFSWLRPTTLVGAHCELNSHVANNRLQLSQVAIRCRVFWALASLKSGCSLTLSDDPDIMIRGKWLKSPCGFQSGRS